MQQALEIAQATFANDLPWGLDTRVGEQGMSLSGGQRQRLALARAVLARPAVLVLDDTLSALDVHTEALVEEALRNVLAETTGIVVAHRASTVMLADQVALLENGTITHVGTHSELLATVPAYRTAAGGRRGGGARMTTTQQTPQPSVEQQHDWRGYAEEGNDELSRATTVRLKEQSRKLLGELLRPYKKMIWLLVVIVVVENAARLPCRTWSTSASTRASRRSWRARAARRCHDRLDRARLRADPGRRPADLPDAVGPARADDPARPAPAGLRPLPAAQPVVPRQVHVGPGDLPADLRRGCHRRDAGDRLRRSGDGTADPGRYGDPAAHAGRQARPARVAVVPGAVPAHRMVPAPVALSSTGGRARP